MKIPFSIVPGQLHRSGLLCMQEVHLAPLSWLSPPMTDIYFSVYISPNKYNIQPICYDILVVAYII